METKQTECKRCGTCCSKGGPALHREDLPLIERGTVPLKRLITIRKGELVYKPYTSAPIAARCELIKFSGTGKEWQCFYYDYEEKGCMIYTERPVSCRRLKCWDTAAVEQLVEEDTLDRFDIVAPDAPVLFFIQEHENSCPCPDLQALQSAIEQRAVVDLQELEELVNEDIRIRTAAVQKLKISLAEELFYFGRPMFQLLQQLGVKVVEKESRLVLRLP
ncbi:MAG: YkgJ family cysteine cluster protein [Desulfopila sp.]